MLDSTDTNGVLDGSDSDVSLLSPAGGPGVSDDVVVTNGLISSPSNSSDSVVKLGSTSSRVDDTASVVMEDFLIGLNSYGDDTLLDGTLEASSRSLRNVGIVLDGNGTSGHASMASSRNTSLGGIRVIALKGLTVILQVLEGFVLPTSIATIASSVAGD